MFLGQIRRDSNDPEEKRHAFQCVPDFVAINNKIDADANFPFLYQTGQMLRLIFTGPETTSCLKTNTIEISTDSCIPGKFYELSLENHHIPLILK